MGEAGGSAAPFAPRRQLLVPRGSKQTAESRWSQPDLVSLLCFLAREAQQILRASADQGERRRLGHGTGQLPSHPHQDISHVHRVLAGDMSSQVPRASTEAETEAAASAAAYWAQTAHRARATAQRTTPAPNIWHSQAAALEGRQRPAGLGQPCPGAAGCGSPSAPSRKWGNSKTIIIIMITITKKNVNNPAPCPVPPRHPREQGMLQSQGRWRHNWPGQCGVLSLLHFASYIFLYIYL